MGAPGGVPGPRTFCLKRRPVRAAFSRCSVSGLASGQPSTEPILQQWSPTASRQPQYAVPHAAGFLGVGVCYESIASEKNAPASLSKRPRNKHLQDKVQCVEITGPAPVGCRSGAGAALAHVSQRVSPAGASALGGTFAFCAGLPRRICSPLS